MKILKFITAFLLSLVPSLANAASPTNKISLTPNTQLQIQGSSTFSAAARNQSTTFEQRQFSDGTNNRNNQNLALENNSQLYLKLENKASTFSKNKFGATLKVEAEASSAQNKSTINADQGFIYADSEAFGKFELGDNIAVNQKMKVGPASFARGAGGINGNYLKYLNLPISSQFILIAQSPIGHGGYASSGSQLNSDSIKILRNGSFNGAEDATKLNYYSPRIAGLQIGASYTPNTANSVVSSTVFSGQNNAISDVFSAGANYTDNFENFDYAFSATAEQGRSKTTSQNNLSSYDIATTMAYFGFTFGASYGNWKKSLQNNDHNFKNATYKTLGISYQIGHFSVGLTNLKSSFQKNDYQATSLGLDYKLSKAFMPYFEITQFKFSPAQNITSNVGFVALGGFVLSF